jgi:hypothetical protein
MLLSAFEYTHPLHFEGVSFQDLQHTAEIRSLNITYYDTMKTHSGCRTILMLQSVEGPK